MSPGRRALSWSAAVLAVTALVSGLVFFIQALTGWFFMDQAGLVRVFILFAVAGGLACGVACLASPRPGALSAPGRALPAWARLPESRPARGALALTAMCFLVVYLFITPALVQVFGWLRVPPAAAGPVFQVLERLTPWAITVLAVSAFGLGLAAWRKPSDRGVVLLLPLLPALLTAGFLILTVLGPD